LHIEQIGDWFVETLSPQLTTGLRSDKLYVHPKSIAAPLYRTFEHVADVQLSADPLQID